jgi:L-lactate dehydrogenase complex protein LldG
MNTRDQIFKALKGRKKKNFSLPEIKSISAFQKFDLVQKLKIEFESAGGIFIRSKFEKVFDEVSKIINDEKIDKIFIESFDNELDNLLKNLPAKQIMIQPHSVKQIAEVDASITGCDFLIAETGTIVLKHTSNRFKSGALLPRVHIVIANEGQIFGTLEEVFSRIDEKFDSLLFITGPSRTADIEKVIVRGVHGPQKVYLILT